ncbi:MAG TPA: hypothetical protein PK593_08040 [Thermomicrobiales bacterium]|nr:hypothetical protein [Thermomicrobiales bacterium]HRA30978.1 hypothetical protein [Thermomicrobiales bacterium]
MSPHTKRQRPGPDEADSRYVYHEDPSEMRTVVWASVWTLFAFKVVTSILILIVFPTLDAVAVVVALSVPWFIAALFYFGVTGRVRMRLLRVRARRRKLIYQEWNVE